MNRLDEFIEINQKSSFINIFILLLMGGQEICINRKKENFRKKK